MSDSESATVGFCYNKNILCRIRVIKQADLFLQFSVYKNILVDTSWRFIISYHREAGAATSFGKE